LVRMVMKEFGGHWGQSKTCQKGQELAASLFMISNLPSRHRYSSNWNDGEYKNDYTDQ
jgi:hypothetical protein